jgi:hypothetical protein
MKKIFAIAVAALILISCAAATSPSGVYRPSLMTTRHSYVENFPCGTATKQEVLTYVGTPDSTHKDDGIEYLTYTIRDDQHGKIQYTYFIKDGVVVDVRVMNHWTFGNEVYQHSMMKR